MPSWSDMLPFLQLIRITTLRLEADDPEEQNAKYWLRDRILVQANGAEAAWKLLKDKAIGLAKRKSRLLQPVRDERRLVRREARHRRPRGRPTSSSSSRH